MGLTYNEITVVIDMKYFPSEKIGYTLPPGIYEISDINKTLNFLLPDFVKVSITNDDIELKSNLQNIRTFIFTKRSFFYTILGFVESHLGVLGDTDGFVELIPGVHKSDKPINITGTDKIHLKCDCINGSIVNGVRKPILYSFGLSSPPGIKYAKNQK